MFDLILEEHKAANNSSSAVLYWEMSLMLKYKAWHDRHPTQQRPLTRNVGLGVVQAYMTFASEEDAAVFKLTHWESLNV